MRIIGLDIHRAFAEAVVLEDGVCKRLGRIGMTRDHLRAFAETLHPTDHVIVEATGNATAVLEILAPQVERVAVANPFQVHLIARAKTKTDKIDARVLAQLYAAGFLPEVWIPDEATLARRRQVTRRNQFVKSRVRLKLIVQSILHAHLVPRCPHADLFGGKGRTWLRAQELPDDERAAIESHLAEYDRQTEALKLVERGIAEVALNDGNVKRLMTIPGIDMVVAVGVMAAIGRIDRFVCPDKLVAYLGLNPSVRQSGDGPARHGRISKRGRSDARHLLVEAAWQTVRSPGPMRAFYERVKGRRGTHVAAVAVARKLAVLIWHMLTKEEDYAWGRPALMARKLRSLELTAGKPARNGQRGSAYDYNQPERRRAEREQVEQSERAYRRLTEHWRRQGSQKGAGAANEERR
jgi:transposase